METTTTIEPPVSTHNGADNDEGPLTLEDLPPHLRQDPLTKLWLAAIQEAVQNGEPFLTIDEINQEVARRRGGIG